MKKILVIDPGKGWGHFVSKIYAFRALSENLNSKINKISKANLNDGGEGAIYIFLKNTKKFTK